MRVRRLMICLAALLLFGSAFISLYWFSVRPDDPTSFQLWLGAGSAITLILACFFLVSIALSDNTHRVKSGRVLSHKLVLAHQTRPIHLPATPPTPYTPGSHTVHVPGKWVGDQWALLLEDKRGHKGWMYFDRDIRREYPIGSFYDSKEERKRRRK